MANKECYQCGIPITGKSLKYDIGNGKVEDFCCFGCYLINKTTGLRGEEGNAVAFLGKFGFGYFLAMLVFMLSTYLYGAHMTPDDPQAIAFTNIIKYVILVLATPVMILLGVPILKNSFSRHNWLNFNTDTLIAIGSFSAYFLSVYSVFTNKPSIYFETATMILVLVTFGRYLETSSRVKASNFMKELLKLMPQKARIIRENKEIEIPIENVKVGDILLIKPGEKISADGIIIDGEAHIDESMLTGETKPIAKGKNDEVYAGTINIDGHLKIKVIKPSNEWTLNKFIKMMKEIRNSKAPITRITDTISAYLLPVMLSLSTGAFAYWYMVDGFEKALITSMSVLLISCPCAFSIGAPLALWIGLSEAFREGIIVKGADILEKLASVKTIFFDKTGTITERFLIVHKVKAKNEEVIKKVYCLEKYSEHPLAVSFITYCKLKNIEANCEVKDFKVHFGYGIEGRVNGEKLYIGSKKFAEKFSLHIPEEILKIEEEAEKNAEIPVFIFNDKEILGIITFTQKIKDEAPIAIKALKKLKIKIEILTGDTPYFAKILKEKIGIENIKAGLFPEDKIKEIEKEKKKGKVVAMVGDGINDAPSMVKADIGIAMGCGTDITKESANISLVSDDLRKVPLVLILARKVRKVIYTNIFWAFIYNIIGIGFALTGNLNPILAALAMVLSSAFVIGNSVRVKNW